MTLVRLYKPFYLPLFDDRSSKRIRKFASKGGLPDTLWKDVIPRVHHKVSFNCVHQKKDSSQHFLVLLAHDIDTSEDSICTCIMISIQHPKLEVAAALLFEYFNTVDECRASYDGGKKFQQRTHAINTISKTYLNILRAPTETFFSLYKVLEQLYLQHMIPFPSYAHSSGHHTQQTHACKISIVCPVTKSIHCRGRGTQAVRLKTHIYSPNDSPTLMLHVFRKIPHTET